MLFTNVAVVDENFEVQTGWFIGTKEDRIAYVSDKAPENPQSFGRTIDGTDRILIPGLYNAHSHGPMTLLRGYAENLSLSAWLNTRVWPFEAKMTAEDNYWAMLLACAEFSRFGGVSFSDMYYALPERAQAVMEAGMKANLCEGLLAFEEKPYREYPLFKQNEEFVREFNGADNGKIRVDYNIHAEYTSNPQVCRDIAQIVKEKGLRIHLHASETKSEVEECKQRHDGMTPIAYFESLGVLDVPVTAAHCVWLEGNDIQILKDKGVYVANNPASNMKLGSGFAPIPTLLDQGVSVCLGTDGMASNNNHDMFKDMYLMAIIYKGYTLDPAVVTPAQVLKAATRTGALSQGRDDCGLIKEGMKADLCLVDMKSPSWTPAPDILNNVMYASSGSDVVMTVSDGQVIYEDGEWPSLDIERIKSEVDQRLNRILGEL